MPSYQSPSGGRTPFGSNEFLRSTQDVKYESYTIAAGSVAVEVIDGSNQKVVKPGEVMAKITSGPDAGKVGPFQAGATDGRQTLTNIVGLLGTWLPWQLLEHDEQVAVCYEATVVQAWCTERDASGARVPLTNTTIDAMRGVKGLDIHAK